MNIDAQEIIKFCLSSNIRLVDLHLQIAYGFIEINAHHIFRARNPKLMRFMAPIFDAY